MVNAAVKSPKPKRKLVDRERTVNLLFLPLLGLTFVAALLASAAAALTSQAIMLIHMLGGTVLVVISVYYLLLHIWRTLGFRRPLTLLSGLLCSVAMIFMLASGAWLGYHGRTEALSWIPWSHNALAWSFLALLVLHIVLHRVTLPLNRLRQGSAFASLAKKPLLKSGFVCALVLGLAVITLLYADRVQQEALTVEVENYRYPYGENPFAPSETTTDNMAFVAQHQLDQSHVCKDCHQDIFEQWETSLHRQAASDPAYEKNINLLVDKKGIEAARYCEGCHAPIALLTGSLTEGGTHGGVENTAANDQGISCQSCHGVSGLPNTKGVGSYHWTHAQRYLFDHNETSVLQWLNQRLIAAMPDQHKQDMANATLKGATFCASCHVQYMDERLNEWGWVPMQNEYAAWLNSAYSGQGTDNIHHQEALNCQDCHMPMVKAQDPSANAQGYVKHHGFPGANTAIPFLNGDWEQLTLTENFLTDNKMNLTIEIPNEARGPETRLPLEEALRTYREKGDYVYAGDTLTFSVIVHNTGVGHNFPGGTIDLHEAWIAVTVKDSSGKTLLDSGFVRDRVVDVDAHSYRSVPIDRKGKHVWKHDLFNMVGEAYNHTIPANESDVALFNVEVPSSATGPLTIVASLKYRKLNHQYAEWVLGQDYPELPITTLARDIENISVRPRREVDAAYPASPGSSM